MRIYLFILILVTVMNVAKAADINTTVDNSTTEELCLDIANTDEEIDQCMDQDYSSVNVEISKGNI